MKKIILLIFVATLTSCGSTEEKKKGFEYNRTQSEKTKAVTSNNTTSTNMYNLFQDKLKDARFVDSTEGQNVDQDLGMTDVIDAGTFINSRF